ncbi:MAG: CAP domain-containing protein [Thermincolia bacterium]
MNLKKALSMSVTTVLLTVSLVSPAAAADYSTSQNCVKVYKIAGYPSYVVKKYFKLPSRPSTLVLKPAPKPTPKPTPNPAPIPTTPTPVPAPGTNEGLSQFETKVVELVNVERSKAGLKPLVADSLLSKGARAKSQDMADQGYFNHNSPKYGSPFDMMKTFGVKYNAAGENIAAGQTTPEAVVTGWMNSPGHRANILNPKFGKIGVGYVTVNKGYRHYWTQWFTN